MSPWVGSSSAQRRTNRSATPNTGLGPSLTSKSLPWSELGEDGGMEIRQAQAADWEALRQLRPGALADAPGAFASTLEGEVAFPAEVWSTMGCDGIAPDALEQHPPLRGQVLLPGPRHLVIGTLAAGQANRTDALGHAGRTGKAWPPPAEKPTTANRSRPSRSARAWTSSAPRRGDQAAGRLLRAALLGGSRCTWPGNCCSSSACTAR